MQGYYPALNTYGEPGGIWLAYALHNTRLYYAVYNEGGDILFKTPYEQDCIDFCVGTIEQERKKLESNIGI